MKRYAPQVTSLTNLSIATKVVAFSQSDLGDLCSQLNAGLTVSHHEVTVYQLGQH
jgi:hypothetical protein